MDFLRQDLHYAFRVLFKNPGFTVIAVVTLALGIGANTAIFSVVYGVLIRPLPYPDADQIVELREVNADGKAMNFADPNFEDIRSQNHTLEGVAEYGTGLVSVSGGIEPTRTMMASVSRDFFSVIRVRPILGRGFTSEDQRFGAAPVILVSYSYWQQYLGSTRDLSTIHLSIGSQSNSVIGVFPPGFRFPNDADIWSPRELFESLPSRSAHNWPVLARLREEVKLSAARAEFSGIARRLKQQYGQDTMMIDVAVSRLRDSLTRDVRPALLVLLGAVSFMLLVACANVVNLLLAQATARQRELAIRTALGAGRTRLVRQFLTEALLLSFTGGALGVIAARGGVDALLAIAPGNLPRLQEVSVNLPVLFFTLGISVLIAVVMGVLTALNAPTGKLHGSMTERGQGHVGAQREKRLGHMIVVFQIAVTLVLLVGAGLLGRSLWRVLSVNPGFRTEHVLTIDLALPLAYDDAKRIPRAQFLSELIRRLHSILGVREAGGTGRLPLTPFLSNGTFVMMTPADKPPQTMQELEGLYQDTSRTGDAEYCPASDGYFRALGIPLIHGRLFDERDTMDAPHAALISQSLARQKWPNQDPLGRLIEFGNMDGDPRLLRIVGVVGDVRQENLEVPPPPTIYVNILQRPQASHRFTAVLRSEVDPTSLMAAARQIVRSLDPTVPPSFNTFTQVLSASLQVRRFNLILLSIFAVTALLLAVAGIYGVMAYSVVQRTSEIGVRIALGACAADVLSLILSQGMLTIVVGVALGIGGSFILTRLMESLLFGVSATDTLTFAGVALLLTLVALLANYIPARRAMKVDPMVALRHE